MEFVTPAQRDNRPVRTTVAVERDPAGEEGRLDVLVASAQVERAAETVAEQVLDEDDAARSNRLVDRREPVGERAEKQRVRCDSATIQRDGARARGPVEVANDPVQRPSKDSPIAGPDELRGAGHEQRGLGMHSDPGTQELVGSPSPHGAAVKSDHHPPAGDEQEPDSQHRKRVHRPHVDDGTSVRLNGP